MPIGNLTSQIFANIYLNEFDRFAKHNLKTKAYLRYGDDFIMVENKFQKLCDLRVKAVDFLENVLKLQLNPKSDRILKSKHGLKFLGVVIWPFERKLNKRNLKRVYEKLNRNNAAGYLGILKHHMNYKSIKKFQWVVSEKILFDK